MLGKKLAEAITGNKSSLFSKLYKKPIKTIKEFGKNTSKYNLFKRYIGATEKRNAKAYYKYIPRKPINIE